jgi:hypothetical protein
MPAVLHWPPVAATSGRSLDIQLPAINNVHDVLPAMAAIASAVSNGNLTAEEASHLVHLVESYERAVINTDFAVRLEKLESRMNKWSFMIRDLEKRLRKLESRLPPEESEEEKIERALFLFLMDAIGYYLGDPKPNEPPVAGFSRALGYEQREFLKILKPIASGGKDPDYDQKYALANRKLFAKFGVDLDTSDWKETVEALTRMHAGLPESRKERLAISL